MVTNVSFALLDTAIIRGRGEDPVIGATTHARLLEEVAALGGVLHHLGVSVGVPVVIELADDADAVVAALATARVGGVVHTSDHEESPVVVGDAGTELPRDGRVRLLRGTDVGEPDLEWDVMLRAGRTDPAAVEVLDPGAAYAPEVTVGELIEQLGGLRAPYDPGELRRVLRV